MSVEKHEIMKACNAITQFDGCCKHYCSFVGREHELKNNRCPEHQDFGPDTKFPYCTPFMGDVESSRTISAENLGWKDEPSRPFYINDRGYRVYGPFQTPSKPLRRSARILARNK